MNTEIKEGIDFEISFAVSANENDTFECVPIVSSAPLHEANECESPVKGVNDILFSALEGDGESFVSENISSGNLSDVTLCQMSQLTAKNFSPGPCPV